MSFARSFLAGTPRPLKFIIYLIAGTSLGLALFAAFPIAKTAAVLLAISPLGAKNLLLWQAITHVFYYPSGGAISLGFLINIFFACYMLLFTGKMVIEMRGMRHFYTLFFGSALFSGLTAMAVLYFFPTMTIVAGASSVISALLITWLFLFPDAQVLLFLMIPVKTKWLIPGFLAFQGIHAFSEGDYVFFASSAAAVLFGYLYNVITFRMHSPYFALHKFESALLRVKSKTQSTPTADSFAERSKIYDFKTGKVVLEDEAFMDACLEKIALHGKKSLTFWERYRLRKISRQKGRSRRVDSF
ncbi:MAG: rhomboid family intramembrane serine protease [Candidatus Algichlamydia australiensis]|nr:rhomboid family intramembrane serine protease [Chlamydiales bacterium]